MFGSANTGSSNFSFGQNKPASTGGGFSFGGGANNNTPTNNTAGGGFNFGNKPAASTGGGFGFGAGSGAGSSTNTGTSTGFGATAGGNTNNTNTGGFGFGANNTNGNALGGQNAPSSIGGFGFGSSNNNSNTGTGSTGGFGFGNNGAAAASGATTGGLFGAKPASAAPSTGGGLFGAKPAGTASSGFGFGGNASLNTGTNSLTSGSKGFGFGGSAANNTTAAAGSGGLFGSKPLGSTTAPATGGLFGNNNTSSQFSFGAKPAGTTGALGGGLFGSSNTAPSTTLGGGLFGQQSNQLITQQQGQQPQFQLTGMTKMSDLPPAFQEELKQLDEYIQTQVNIAEYLKNEESKHGELIASVPRDLNFLEKKQSSTKQGLTSDLKFVETFKNDALEKFNDWVEKLIKVFLQLTNPMSGSNNDQGQSANTSKVIIGVSGNRTELEQSQNQQQNQQNSNQLSSINVSQTLNSFYVEKIEDFKAKIGQYELLLKEVENCINDLENPTPFSSLEADRNSDDNMPSFGKTGLEMIFSALQEEFNLYVELANDYAEIHHEIEKLKGGETAF